MSTVAWTVPLIPLDGPASWWQQQHPSPGYASVERDADTDICVVGAGISGTSTALHLARTGARVTLVEAREVAGGASGRNGGFLLAGLAVRYETLVARLGASRAADLYRQTAEFRDELLTTAGRLGLGDFARRTGSLRLAVDAGEVGDLDREYALLRSAGIPARRLTSRDLPHALAPHFLGGLAFDEDGASVPAAWVRGLAIEANRLGVTIHEHSPVTAIDDAGDRRSVVTDGGTVSCEHVVVCTEAYLGALLPELASVITPYRSQVLAARGPAVAGTAPLPRPVWSRRGWDYAQLTVDGTYVVGGERIEDPALYAGWDETIDDADQAHLEAWLERVTGEPVDVLTRWAGVLAYNHDGFPYVGAIPGRAGVYSCGGWGGAGNVLGFAGGRMVADLLAGDASAIPPEFDPARVVSADD